MGRRTTRSQNKKLPPSENGSTCSCKCESKLETLENEIEDLKSWKADRQQLDDVISKWKEEVDNWMRSSTLALNAVSNKTCASENGSSNNKNSTPSKVPESAKKVASKASSEEVKENSAAEEESVSEDALHDPNTEEFRAIEDDIRELMDSGQTENVEITPDIFCHFLLDTGDDGAHEDAYGELSDSIQSCESLGGEEEEPEGPVQRSRKGKRRQNDESDSEVYTVSSSSTDSDEYTTDDEYMPQPKRGRGRPVVTNISQIQSLKTLNMSKSNYKPNETVGMENNKELTQHITKRPGNIWECNVCGFMLSSFENMLLHVKYNHSSSTHTCPYCRVVVLCRSPKDAIIHQAQCKMRQSSSAPVNVKVRPPAPVYSKSVIRPSRILSKKEQEEAANAEVDKFVSELLEPSTSSRSRSLTNKTKKTGPPAVVTLSSDDDE